MTSIEDRITNAVIDGVGGKPVCWVRVDPQADSPRFIVGWVNEREGGTHYVRLDDPRADGGELVFGRYLWNARRKQVREAVEDRAREHDAEGLCLPINGGISYKHPSRA